MSFNAVTASAANNTMITVRVHNIVTERTEVFGREYWHTQSPLDHRDKQLSLHTIARTLGWHGVQPSASVWRRNQVQMSLRSERGLRWVGKAREGRIV
jgi:hypothetical protein